MTFFKSHQKLHIWLLADLVLLAAFWIAREHRDWMNALERFVSAPIRRSLGSLCYRVSFSVMEVLYVLAAVLVLAYVVWNITAVVRARGRRKRRAYSAVLGAELLPRSLDRVLYLDPDILVINPVRALYDTDLEGDLMAAATHTGLLAGITDPVNRLRLENYEAEAYYNSGVLVMDLSAMRREVRPGDIFDYAREHADILLMPDQDVLNGLYGGQILGVDDSLWNYDARRFDRYLLLSQGERDMDWVMDHTAILHFCGKRKPWNHSYQGRFSALYKHYQRLVERR